MTAVGAKGDASYQGSLNPPEAPGGEYNGGYGAAITATFSVCATCLVHQSDVLYLMPGGEGKGDEAPNGGGGGGGSFVWNNTTSTLLLAAGGGGGAGILQDGYPASLSITPNPSGGDYPTRSPGYGGNSVSNGGGGGAGFIGNGAGHGTDEGQGGKDYANGFIGGNGATGNADPNIYGGYGGGGGAG